MLISLKLVSSHLATEWNTGSACVRERNPRRTTITRTRRERVSRREEPVSAECCFSCISIPSTPVHDSCEWEIVKVCAISFLSSHRDCTSSSVTPLRTSLCYYSLTFMCRLHCWQKAENWKRTMRTLYISHSVSLYIRSSKERLWQWSLLDRKVQTLHRNRNTEQSASFTIGFALRVLRQSVKLLIMLTRSFLVRRCICSSWWSLCLFSSLPFSPYPFPCFYIIFILQNLLLLLFVSLFLFFLRSPSTNHGKRVSMVGSHADDDEEEEEKKKTMMVMLLMMMMTIRRSRKKKKKIWGFSSWLLSFFLLWALCRLCFVSCPFLLISLPFSPRTRHCFLIMGFCFLRSTAISTPSSFSSSHHLPLFASVSPYFPSLFLLFLQGMLQAFLLPGDVRIVLSVCLATAISNRFSVFITSSSRIPSIGVCCPSSFYHSFSGYGSGLFAPGRCSNHSLCLAGNSGIEPFLFLPPFLRPCFSSWFFLLLLLSGLSCRIWVRSFCSWSLVESHSLSGDNSTIEPFLFLLFFPPLSLPSSWYCSCWWWWC